MYAKKDGLDAFEFHAAVSQLNQRALALFKRVRKASNRSGEAGELLLYLLTEWILGAPQIIAKMGLKTNPQMPVHGSDGVHVRVRSEEHTSELRSLMRISYAVFCLKKKQKT